MTTNGEAIRTMQDVMWEAQYARDKSVLTGRRIDANTVTMAGAVNGKTWVRSSDDSRESWQVFGYASQANVNAVVRPLPSGEYYILMLDHPKSQAQGGHELQGSLVAPINGNITPVNVYGINFVPGRVRLTDAGGLTVFAESVPALGFIGTQFVMTPPATASKHAWCIVCLNPLTGALSQVNGAEYDTTITLTDALLADVTVTLGLIPLGAIKLANGQTTIAASDIADFRQHIGVRVPYSTYAAGAAPTTSDDTDDGYSVGSYWYDTTNDRAYVCLDASAGAAVWLRIDNASGLMSSFTLTGDSGTPQTISDANALTVEGGTAVNTVAGATDKVTVNFDLTELTNENTVDGATDYIVFYDASASAHRKTLVDNLPSVGAGTLTVKEVDGTPLVNNVDTIVVSNGTLTDDGGGQVTITTGGGGGGGSISRGVYASLPGSPASGDVYLVTDAPYTLYYDGSAWQARHQDWELELPTTTGFSWTNQGSATATLNGALTLYTPGSAGISERVYTKTAPSTPYTITAAFRLSVLHATSTSAVDVGGGLCFRQSSDGKLVSFITASVVNGASSLGLFSVTKFNTATSYNSDYKILNYGDTVSRDLIWLRIQDNGTNRICSYSMDGYNWMVYDTVGRTDFLTADQVGFFVHGNGSTLTECYMQILHYVET